MENLDKLGKEFDNAIGSMTNEDWDKWIENRVRNKEIRRRAMTIKAINHFRKLKETIDK
jgi:trans-2-enoyl-CoA reductase